MSKGNPKAVAVEIATELKNIFQKHGLLSRETAWKRLTTGEGKKQMDLLVRYPNRSIGNIQRLTFRETTMSFRQFLESENDAQRLGEELWRRKNDIIRVNHYWKGITRKECMEMAQKYVNGNPHERGMFMKVIQDIAAEVLGKGGRGKAFYMDNIEAQRWLALQNKDVKEMTIDELVDVVNKSIGILGGEHPDMSGWSDEAIHPGMSAGLLRQIEGMRFSSVQELRRRFPTMSQQELQHVNMQLDPENRRFFFTR